MLTYTINNKYTFHPVIFNFPAGEVGVKLVEFDYREEVNYLYIEVVLCNSNDILALLNLVDALRRKYKDVDLNLVMPYVPYARQDRVCVEGESFSLKVFTDLINSCNFSRVLIFDPHSDVTAALLKNVEVVHNYEVFRHVFTEAEWGNAVIVAPDAGAAKKAYKFAEQVKAKDVLIANKKRNLHTGEITGYSLSGVNAGDHLVVIDDICDGGRTFEELWKVAKPANPRKIDLIVSHGVFSKGVDTLSVMYDNIWTSNSYYDSENAVVKIK